MQCFIIDFDLWICYVRMSISSDSHIEVQQKFEAGIGHVRRAIYRNFGLCNL